MYFFSVDAAEDSREKQRNEISRRKMPDHVCDGNPRDLAMIATFSDALNEQSDPDLREGNADVDQTDRSSC